MISMKKKQNLLLVGGAGLSLLLAGVSVALSGQGNNSLLGEGAYPSAKAMAITFTADDFKAGAKTITKNGNPFSVTGEVSVAGDVITFKQGASLTRAVTSGGTSTNGYQGANGGSLFYEMEIDGLTVAKPSQKVVHAGDTRTWFEVINNRGDGAGRGLYSTAAEADKVGYENLHHIWTNNRDNDDPSAFWIETDNPTLTSEEGTFSFKSITYKYACTAVDNEYSKIMANAKRDGFRFTDKEGNTLPALAPIGGKLEFKVELDPFFAKQYDYTVTVSSDRAEAGRKTLTADASGVYSITVAKQYDTSVAKMGNTYLHLNATEKAGKPITNEAELHAMEENGVYYLANDISVEGPTNQKFAGVLDGKGHRIYNKNNVSGNKSGLFGDFSGVLKNIDVQTIIDFYTEKGAGISDAINGGLYENVTAHTMFKFKVWDDSAPFARKMINGGVIRNSTAYFLANGMGTCNEIASAVASMDKGTKMENVTVKIPCDFDLSKINMVRPAKANGELVNCKMIKSQTKAVDSILTGGELQTETFYGMPVYKKAISGAFTEVFDNTFDLGATDVKHASFFLKLVDAKNAETGDSATLVHMHNNATNDIYATNGTGTAEVWNYIEFIRLDKKGNYRVVNDFFRPDDNTNQGPKMTTREGVTTLGKDLGFGIYKSWGKTGPIWAPVEATAYVTPLYVEY